MANKRLKKKFGRRRNGEGSVSERKDGMFQASIMVNGKRKFEYAPTENEAYEKLETMRDKARRGISLTGGDVTLNELVGCYIDRYAKPYVRPSTLKNYQGYSENYIKNSRIGKMKVSRIAADDVQIYVNDLVSTGLSAKTIRNLVGFMDSVFAQAVRNRIVSFNPCEGVRLPKKKTKERPLITEEEYSRLIEVAEDQTMKTAIAILGLGLRIGELLALQWTDCIEVDGVSVLSVSKTLKREYLFDATAEQKNGKKTEITVSDTKTDSSVRQVPVTSRVLTELEKLKAEQQRISGELGVQFSDDFFIIGTLRDKGFGYITPDKFRADFSKCVKKAGLPKEVTPHALRRYTSSTLIRYGASVVAVAKLLGHSSSATTLTYYSRESLRGILEAVKLLGK
jgi:integrase